MIRESWLIYVRNLKKMWRIPMAIFMSLAMPLIWLVLYTAIFSRMVGYLPKLQFPYRTYLQFFAPGVLGLCALVSAFQSGMGMVSDIETGMLDKFRIAPVRRASILAGKIAADGTRTIAQSLVILGIGHLMGLRIATGWTGVVVVCVLSSAFAVAWTGLSNIVALRTGNAETTMLLGILMTFPLVFLSTSFLPEVLLPQWLQTVSRFNPLSYFVEAVRAVVNSSMSWTLIGKSVLVIVATGAVTLTAATWTFRRVAHSS